MTEDKGILIRNIYYMLSYAFQELRQNNYVEIEGETFDNIFDLFAEIMAIGISSQIKQGLYREYVAKNESLQTIKGKIDVNSTIVNRVCNNRQIVCDYDELSENNIYNQILLTTATILIRHSDVKKDRKSKLKQLMLFFQGVQQIDIHTIHWDALKFDRNNKSYRMLLYLCYFIVKEWLLTTEAGSHKMREFSDDHMNRLFEKFVLEYYKKHYPELKAEAKQINWNIIKEQSTTNVLPIMQTDILLTMRERTLIIDTKYYAKSMQKQFDKSTIHSHNLYQIHTYVTEYDKGHQGNVDGMLLYAKTQEGIVPEGEMKQRDGNTIYFRTLDLNMDFESIKKRLDSFIELWF